MNQLKVTRTADAYNSDWALNYAPKHNRKCIPYHSRTFGQRGPGRNGATSCDYNVKSFEADCWPPMIIAIVRRKEAARELETVKIL